MDWSQALFEVIDFGSFSNLWYWIALAVVWSSSSHWILGAPFDMILRAKRQGGATLADLEALVRINVSRLLYIARESGAWVAGMAAFLLSALGTLGFWYGVELAQAVFLIALPLAIVGLMRVRAARRIEAEAPGGEVLCRLLLRLRIWTQLVGMVSIFVTALYGMYQNLAVIQAF